MAAMKKAGTFRVLSAGRVQGPALALIVNKEREIQKFKSTPYWQVSIILKESNVLLKHSINITKKEKLKEFENIEGQQGIAKTTKIEDRLPPQIPFDLTTLQLEAHRLCGFTPARTLQVAQKLYLAGIISYPRTSSQKLPASIGYDKILKKLPKGLTKFITKKQPVEGAKNDPAHPAVYPTGEPLHPKADDDQEKIYDLIVRRFINCFCDEAIIETKTLKVTVEKKSFTAKGLKIQQRGWTAVYKSRLEERALEDLNGPVTVKKLKVEKKETKPPYRYNDASIVSELSKRNLGTKATRSAIIETLKKRGYIADKKLTATKLGIAVIETLEKNSPSLLDEELTRSFEEEIESIQKSKNGEEKEKEILEKARKILIKISEDLKKNETKIGKLLAEALGEVREEEREASKVMRCKKCEKGWISIRRSRFGQFLACNAYPDCKTTFSLPPYGLKKLLKTKKCEECEWSKFQSFQKGKRPWEFCANPECPSRKKHKSYSKKTEDTNSAKEPKSMVPTAKVTVEKSNKEKLKELAERISKGSKR